MAKKINVKIKYRMSLISFLVSSQMKYNTDCIE